jgi:Ras-related protein Rab-7A
MSLHKRKALLKILLLGQSGVGKSSLLLRFVEKSFTIATKSTIGADFLTKDIEVDGQPVTLQIWDTAGQERFQGLGTSFYRGADGVIFVYDVATRETFEELPAWHQSFLIQTGQEGNTEFPALIVANKVDRDDRQVSKSEGREYCDERNIPYYETSAKEDVNVDRAFEALTRLILSKTSEENMQYETVDLSNTPTKKEGCC